MVKGTLRTEPNLPDHLKQSMFAEEREWPVLCRYSSEPGDPGLDVGAFFEPLQTVQSPLILSRTEYPNPEALL